MQSLKNVKFTVPCAELAVVEKDSKKDSSKEKIMELVQIYL